MGINKQSEIAANLQIGPTDQGMVRLFIETDKLDSDTARALVQITIGLEHGLQRRT